MTQTQSYPRNYGLDILKFLSMVYVIIIHTYGSGGILSASQGFNNRIVIAVMCFATVSVDAFALVTGYASYTDTPKPFNYKKVFDIWAQVVFYCLILTLICYLTLPGKVDSSMFLRACLPVFFNEYWYFTAYFLVTLISPLIHTAVRQLSDTTLKKLIVVTFIIFSILIPFSFEGYAIVNPFTFAWIFILYFWGAAIRKCNIGKNTSSVRLVLAIIACAVITFIWNTVLSVISTHPVEWNNSILDQYNSPTMVISAMCYLVLFSRIRVGEKGRVFLKFIAPCLFAAFLINSHPIIYNEVLFDRFAPLANMNPLLTTLIVISFSLAFTICSCLIDKIRLLLFKLLRIDALIGKISSLTATIIHSISQRL